MERRWGYCFSCSELWCIPKHGHRGDRFYPTRDLLCPNCRTNANCGEIYGALRTMIERHFAWEPLERGVVGATGLLQPRDDIPD